MSAAVLFSSEGAYCDARRAWRAYEVLLAVRSARVFEHMDSRTPRSAEALALAAGLDARVLAACLDVLTAQGLLARDAGGYWIAESSVLRALDERREEVDRIRALAGVLRTGRPIVESAGGVIRGDRDATERFLSGLGRRAAGSADEVVWLVRALWDGRAIRDRGPRVLDLGGGHGALARAIAEAIRGAEVTLFDLPEVVPIARALSGCSFATRGGDWREDDLGGPWDVVLASNVTHSLPAIGARDLYRRIARTLSPAGGVVIRDRCIDDDRRGSPAAADFGITLVLDTPAGLVRTAGEIRELLRGAGLVDIRSYAPDRDEHTCFTAIASEV